MLVATFGPTTGWAGKSISYDDGRFSLEGQGPISATDVLMYDSQGPLIWAYGGLREWVQQKASPPPAPPVPPQTETPQPTTEVRERVQQTPVPPPADPDTAQAVTPQPITPIYEYEPPVEPVPPSPQPKPPRGLDRWGEETQEVFKERAEFAERTIEAGGMEARGRKAGYVNLNSAGRTMAQIHPQTDGIGLVLCRRGDNPPEVLFREIPVASLTGHTGPNARWLDGSGHPYETKGPAVAFLLPDGVDDLGDDAREWQDIARLLRYAKTL